MGLCIISLCLAAVTYSESSSIRYHSHQPFSEWEPNRGLHLSEKFFNQPTTGAYLYPIIHDHYGLRNIPIGKGSQLSAFPIIFGTMDLPKQGNVVDNLRLEYPGTIHDLEILPYISNGKGFQAITIPHFLANIEDTGYLTKKLTEENPGIIHNLNGVKYIPILVAQDTLQVATITQSGHDQYSPSVHHPPQGEEVLGHNLPGDHPEDYKPLATDGATSALQTVTKEQPHKTVTLDQNNHHADWQSSRKKYIIQPDLFQEALEKILAADRTQDALHSTTVTEEKTHEGAVLAGRNPNVIGEFPKEGDIPEHNLFPDIAQNHKQIATDRTEDTSQFGAITHNAPYGGTAINEYYYPYLYQLPREKYLFLNDLTQNGFHKYFGGENGEEHLPTNPITAPDHYRHHGYPRGKYVPEEYKPHNYLYPGNQFSLEDDPSGGTFKRQFDSDLGSRFIRSNDYKANYRYSSNLRYLNLEPKLAAPLSIDGEGSEPKIDVEDKAPETDIEDSVKVDDEDGVPRVDDEDGVPRVNDEDGVPRVDDEDGVPKLDDEDGALEVGAEDGTPKAEENGEQSRGIIDNHADILTTENVPIINVHNIDSINFDLEPVQVEDSPEHQV